MNYYSKFLLLQVLILRSIDWLLCVRPSLWSSLIYSVLLFVCMICWYSPCSLDLNPALVFYKNFLSVKFLYKMLWYLFMFQVDRLALFYIGQLHVILFSHIRQGGLKLAFYLSVHCICIELYTWLPHTGIVYLPVYKLRPEYLDIMSYVNCGV